MSDHEWWYGKDDYRPTFLSDSEPMQNDWLRTVAYDHLWYLMIVDDNWLFD